jgi:hypothetical protein
MPAVLVVVFFGFLCIPILAIGGLMAVAGVGILLAIGGYLVGLSLPTRSGVSVLATWPLVFFVLQSPQLGARRTAVSAGVFLGGAAMALLGGHLGARSRRKGLTALP